MGSTYIFFLTLIRNYNIPNCPRIFPCDRSTHFKLNDFLSSLRLAKTTLQTQIPLRLDTEKRIEMDGPAAPPPASRSCPAPPPSWPASGKCVAVFTEDDQWRPASGEATCRPTVPQGPVDKRLTCAEALETLHRGTHVYTYVKRTIVGRKHVVLETSGIAGRFCKNSKKPIGKKRHSQHLLSACYVVGFL